ncbi:amphi-Trp domain-containing protein [Desulfovibrio psychrotolerans]|uniref:Amphi-Trp domain-containing protein n=1 Tax=Desulfovibrio psychrotolerans TaxID=415242 RepID=A0A7J0BVV3_9BACT|nr:amphi-Trp domain-containing protein [Desulfovibrio psychrotolerans]GFM37839.1 hypothetical protein DSM19430T_25230 [Desulfovibrio psychrotolerans]
MEKNKISVTQQLAFADAVAYLEALVQSLKAGRVVVEQGGEQVVLTTPEHLEVTVEARTKKDRQKFALELEWYSAPAVESAAVTISAVPAAPCCTATAATPDTTATTVTVETTQQAPAEENASSEECATPESPASPEPRHITTAQEKNAPQAVAAPAQPNTAKPAPAPEAPASKAPAPKASAGTAGKNAAVPPRSKAPGQKTGKAGNRSAKKQPAGRRTS